MSNLHNVYIALGSNRGDKFKNIQLALQSIHEQVGSITAIAKVYQSNAVGFTGEDFLNTCILITTYLSPKQVLKILLQIELDLGRVRTQTQGYESRTIDLDIIFYDDIIVENKTLKIPHEQCHNRKFVMYPLRDIALKYIHPIFNKTIETLFNECEDLAVLEPINIWLKNPIKQYNFSAYNYIAIEGNIGAGKTSLATKIATDFNAKLILERFADNAFLPKFYKNQQRYAFTLEMSFLADRYQQISDDLAQLDLFKDFIISDYDVYKSLIFSKVTLEEDEFKLYRKLFELMYKDISKPDLYIYLYQNTEQLQANIKKRGRKYENNIDNTYLEKINAGYLQFLKSKTDLNIKIIDISNKDFIKNRADYLNILNAICSANTPFI